MKYIKIYYIDTDEDWKTNEVLVLDDNEDEEKIEDIIFHTEDDYKEVYENFDGYFDYLESVLQNNNVKHSWLCYDSIIRIKW